MREPASTPAQDGGSSERLTGATLDRLTRRCRIIEAKGDSYRLHDAKVRTRRATQPTITIPEAAPTPAS